MTTIADLLLGEFPALVSRDRDARSRAARESAAARSREAQRQLAAVVLDVRCRVDWDAQSWERQLEVDRFAAHRARDQQAMDAVKAQDRARDLASHAAKRGGHYAWLVTDTSPRSTSARPLPPSGLQAHMAALGERAREACVAIGPAADTIRLPLLALDPANRAAWCTWLAIIDDATSAVCSPTPPAPHIGAPSLEDFDVHAEFTATKGNGTVAFAAPAGAEPCAPNVPREPAEGTNKRIVLDNLRATPGVYVSPNELGSALRARKLGGDDPEGTVRSVVKKLRDDHWPIETAPRESAHAGYTFRPQSRQQGQGSGCSRLPVEPAER